EAVAHIDATGVETLAGLTKELRRDGVTLVVARLHTRLRDHLETSGALHVIGHKRVYAPGRSAAGAFPHPQPRRARWLAPRPACPRDLSLRRARRVRWRSRLGGGVVRVASCAEELEGRLRLRLLLAGQADPLACQVCLRFGCHLEGFGGQALGRELEDPRA